VLVKQPDAKVIISPHQSAVRALSHDTQRNEHNPAIDEHGRNGWKKKT